MNEQAPSEPAPIKPRKDCLTCHGSGVCRWVAPKAMVGKCRCVVGREARAALRAMHKANKTRPVYPLYPAYTPPREVVQGRRRR